MPDIRNLDDLAEYAHQQVARIQRMQEDLADQYGTGESPRGYVRARTGPGGALQELRIDPGALRLSAEDVAAEVTAAIGAAQREYADRANEIITPVLAAAPSKDSLDDLDAGMRRLDGLMDDLDRLARRRGLDG
ncbi:YbaB/EbfC family nucleoid-associated protein [Micromonospora sp. NBC_01699]|uniref:YbaB/EbfC family nucleoid-associated protein n=1 Tax=Micromonospora sp. NBC_01699 TaxID=2975984 RepID=UPI002E28B9D4|nr:YbaB/EbfC family nucleoid-associated protein [Micromonospora sp. NBC_01699]